MQPSYLNVGGGNPWAGQANENLNPIDCSDVYILVRIGTLGAAVPTGSASRCFLMHVYGHICI